MMVRWLLFVLVDYYPSGGMGDCILKTSDKDELIEMLEQRVKRDEEYVEDGYDSLVDAMQLYDFWDDATYNTDDSEEMIEVVNNINTAN